MATAPLTYLALLNALGIGIHLVLRALLHLGLHFQLLVQHPFLLLLLAHHLRLHTLLAGNDIALLVRVIQGIQGLCERGKEVSSAAMIKSCFTVVSSF